MVRSQSVRTARRSRPMVSLLAIVLLAPGLGGCAMRSGAKTIVPARFDYSAAIQRSWKEEMLLNMVRMRYLDPPMFMGVQQVITQYVFDRSASVFWAGDERLYPGANVVGRWAEAPTITYLPMSGDRFIKSVLEPIPPAALISLVQAGWPIDAVFCLALRSLNGLRAGSQLQLLKRTADPQYFEALATLRELQSTGGFSMRLEQKPGAAPVVATFRSRELDQATLEAAKRVRQLLHLNPEATEFTLAIGETQKNDTEIAMVTRSMLEILGEASAGVDIPATDQDEGRALKMGPTGASDSTTFKLSVRSSKEKPSADDAFTAIQYRNRWFWVDDRDLTSKRALSFLLALFAMAESGPSPPPPTMTISKP